jgi:hypothetical protein
VKRLNTAAVKVCEALLASVHANGAEAVADWNNLKSGENYVGYGRTENFSSSGGARPDKRHEYSVPKTLVTNSWALSGIWTMGYVLEKLPFAYRPDSGRGQVNGRYGNVSPTVMQVENS